MDAQGNGCARSWTRKASSIMYLGIDLGTSAVKIVLVDDAQRVVASRSRSLTVSSPRPGHCEQDPAQWIEATFATLDALKADHARELAEVEGIGLSGQMHGATLLDAGHTPLRPCILWNDGRSFAECAELERRWPALRMTTGNKAMPGFTAPKLLWVARHEPEIFAATKLVLQPKAYLRLVLTGEAIEDVSDASGSLWLDVVSRDWSDEGLAATGLSRRQMPRLVEGCAPAARLRTELAQRWGMTGRPMIAGGAGDNPAGAVGIGAINPGAAFISLGTSGALLVPTETIAANPERVVHTFCDAVPDRWIQAGAILSAASCLTWIARLFGTSEADLLAPLGCARGRRRRSASCRISPANAPRTMIPMCAACSMGSVTPPIATRSCKPCWKASPSRSRIAGTCLPRPDLSSRRRMSSAAVRGRGSGCRC
jgi:xylulokinase